MTKIIKATTGSKLEKYASYSRAVVADNWVFVSNTAGKSPETGEFPEDLKEQTLQVFANIERALKAVGSGLEDVVMSRVFIQDPANIHEVMGIVGEKFRGVNPATTATCPPLGSMVYKVELEVTAYKGAGLAEVEEILIEV